jgi:hypothetical protein
MRTGNIPRGFEVGNRREECGPATKADRIAEGHPSATAAAAEGRRRKKKAYAAIQQQANSIENRPRR